MPPADDADVRAPLVLEIARLRRRVRWLETRLLGEDAGEPPTSAVGLLGDDPDADGTVHTFLEEVRADARLEAVDELTAEQSAAMAEYRASERCLTSVAATLEELRRAAGRGTHPPAVREALAWAVRELERAMIAAGPVVEEMTAAERGRVLAAGVEVLALEGLEAAEWVAAVNDRLRAPPRARRPASPEPGAGG